MDRTPQHGARSRPCRLTAAAAVTAITALITAAAGSAPAAPGDAASNAVSQDVARQERLQQLQQIEVDNRYRANEDIPINQRAFIDYGGYITFQYLSIDDKDNNNHGVRQTDLVAYGRYNLDAANEIFARVRATYDDFNKGDEFEGVETGWQDTDIERGYYRFDLGRYEAAYHGKSLPYNITFQAGRDLVYWADGLAMGAVIDGGIVDVSFGKAQIEFIAGVTPVRTVDFDSSRPSFATNTRRGFYGAMASYSIETEHWGNHKPFVYFVTQRDYNSHDFLQQGNISTKFCYDSWYLGTGTTGNFGDHIVYGTEFTFEGGHTLSNSYRINGFSLEQVNQTTDQIQAFAADTRLDYLLNDHRQTRFGAEMVLATGDQDRITTDTTFNGNRANTRDLAYNSFALVNTGLAFAPEVSNLAAVRVSAATYPFVDCDLFHRMQIGTDFFVFNKLQLNRAFSEQSGHKYYLGVEPDVYLNWQITSDLTLAVRYGIFFPSDNLLSHANPRQFVYTGVTFAF